MASRFTYNRMTAEEFREAMDHLGIDHLSLARLTAHKDAGKIRDYANGRREVPYLVGLMLELMMAHPANIVFVRQYAAEMIREDARRPGALYPYLEAPNDGQTTKGNHDDDN